MLASLLKVPKTWPPKGLKNRRFRQLTIVLRLLSRKPCEYPHKRYIVRN